MQMLQKIYILLQKNLLQMLQDISTWLIAVRKLQKSLFLILGQQESTSSDFIC